LNLVLLFGIIIAGGAFGARLFQKLNIPQVVGCIIVGILLGDVFNLITPHTIEKLHPFTMFALGLIGFMIGGELKADIFKKYGKQFFIILLSQGIGAFLLVAVATSIMTWLVTGQPAMAVAAGLILGAIASATAPAATVNVLWEFKTRGPLTAAILAIVALDDALALLLFRAASTAAKAVVGTGHDSFLTTAAVLSAEIIGTVMLGFIAGVLLFIILKFVKTDENILLFVISCLMLVVGITIIHDIDPILPAMVLGVTIANLAPRQSKSIFELVKNFTPPVYISFFVLAGAHMKFATIAPWMIIMITIFVLFRAFGKVAGAWIGAKYSDAPAVVRKYLGICLLPQAGVAIGLAILAQKQFDAQLGHIIFMVVMTATFLMEITGPMLVKFGVKKAGEIGLNITEEDLIKTSSISEVMDSEPVTIPQDLPLGRILEIFSTTDFLYYPVVDSESRIVGVITVANIKEMFANRDVADWLLACDVAEPVIDKTTPDKLLEDALDYIRKYDLEQIPVVAADDTDTLLGILDYRKTNRKISAEVLRRRKIADGTPTPTA
jgi:Kef-type K+ transport system membrane component KefB